ncbi:MAG: EpsD family peptidyl-prolyl cis-trans isomerase [Sphingobium sp.]|nr:EpsD family peptidyl-prolyl cis-trans isomerase [Sphingobium sp.]
MSRLTSVSLIALTSLSLALAGCQKKAEGQVVAVVNGEEITSNELNNELAELNVPANVDKTRIRAEVLQRMVERRLLAQAAKDSGLDRDPTYINQERRMKEQLLVSMYGKKAFDTVAVPNTAKVDQYIASHPTLFGDRTRYKLDQIVFDPPADAKALQPLTGMHSMADIAAWLNKQGIKFQRGGNTMDSAGVPPEVMARIKALPAGEPFIVPNNGKIVASVITGSEPVVVPTDQARPLATQAIRREELNKIGEERLKEAKAKAKIVYQAGYEPPKAPAAAGAAPAAK